jgi:hypothetical protein
MRQDSAGMANLSRSRPGCDLRGEECCATDQRSHEIGKATLAHVVDARDAIAIANGPVGQHACLRMVLYRWSLSARAAHTLSTVPRMIAGHCFSRSAQRPISCLAQTRPRDTVALTSGLAPITARLGIPSQISNVPIAEVHIPTDEKHRAGLLRRYWSGRINPATIQPLMNKIAKVPQTGAKANVA